MQPQVRPSSSFGGHRRPLRGLEARIHSGLQRRPQTSIVAACRMPGVPTRHPGCQGSNDLYLDLNRFSTAGR